MNHPPFIQLYTAEYTYTRNYITGTSHCIYALDETGEAWKYIPGEQKWILIEDMDPNYGMDKRY